MSDHFVDAAYQKHHVHNPLGGTPHLEDEDNYRRKHMGRDINLSDLLFAESYPTNVAPEDIKTRPKCDY
jgi:hypothetical protein